VAAGRRSVTMDSLPASWSLLCTLAFALGLRHGFDADHLATIDGITRRNAAANPALARGAGLLFALGHGAVVLAVALAVAATSERWQAPGWLAPAGTVVSVAFLFGLAFLNLRAVWSADPGTLVAPVGLKGRLLGRVLTVRRPWAIAGVGALFALSFDTVSLAAVFAVAAARFGGIADVALVAGVFAAGMLLIDSVNGWSVQALLRRADRRAAMASRVMALTVAGVSLAVGLLAVARVLVPTIEQRLDGHEVLLSVAIVASVLLAFALSMLATRRVPAAA
jgi:high-affinity nickel-transport protein